MTSARSRARSRAKWLRGRIKGTMPSRRESEILAQVFDPDFYLDANPEVRETGLEPWTHYLDYGFAEGRPPNLDPPGSVQPASRRVASGPGPRVSVFTSINLAYLDRAILLAESLRAHEPDWHRVVVLVEPELPEEGPLSEALRSFDEVILARDLFGVAFDSWVFGLSVVEACTAVKGGVLAELLQREDCDAVVYLDPDTWVLRPMRGVIDALSAASGVVTPHILEPATTLAAIWDGEVGSLKHGVFNLGFLGVRDCDEGRSLAAWWAQRLSLACWDEPERGLFTDQKWMNLAPVFFPGTRVLHDPGLNVASWNLASRKLTRGDAGYEVSGSPLTFFHFTKAETTGPQMTALHAPGESAVAELWSEYLSALRRVQAGLPPIPEWGYGRYRDGSRISPEERRIARKRRRPAAINPDPFAGPPPRIQRAVRRLQDRWIA